MNTGIKSRLDSAMASDEPEHQLIEVVEQLKQKGWNQLEIYDVFETYMLFLRESAHETEEDIVTEVLSFIWGWCSYSARLFPHTLSNEKVSQHKQSGQS